MTVYFEVARAKGLISKETVVACRSFRTLRSGESAYCLAKPQLSFPAVIYLEGSGNHLSPVPEYLADPSERNVHIATSLVSFVSRNIITCKNKFC